MSELFDLICKKESLNAQEHQLSLPRIGNKELTYESGTVLGSLKIREVSIIYVGVASDNGEASGGTSPVQVESLLEDETQKGKQLDITLPNGQQRSLLVPLNMSVRTLETYISKKENLNPRYYSLQSIDFKHQCFDAGSAVGDIEFTELRLLDKRGHSSRSKLTKNSSSDDSCVGNSSRTNLSAGLKANRLYSSQESLDFEQRNATRKDSKTSSNSDELATISERKPPVPPQPYMAQSSKPSKANDKLQVNELRSSQSFSEYGEKRTSLAVREPSLREGSKPKRKAPRPPRPPQPSPRPTKKDVDQNQPPAHPAPEKVAAVGSSVITPQGSPSLSPNQRYKKRPAPARPPAPKALRQRSGSNLSADDTVAEATKNHDRPPPVFCPPPPPDDEPPPLDECEYPVSPLSEEELHDSTWSSTFESPEINGYPEEMEHSSSIKTEAKEPPVAALRRQKPEKPKQPERPAPPARLSSLPSTPTSPDPPDHTVTSPEPIPLKFLIPTPEKRPESATSQQQGDDHDEDLTRISFDCDSRSSSVDISSFPESEMPMLSPIEGYKPFPVSPPTEFAEKEDNITVTDTKTLESQSEEHTLPPPLGFSKSESAEQTTNLSISNDSGNVECSGTESDVTIEDMVIPPPPVLMEEELQPDDTSEKPDSNSQKDVINSIPPPMDFAPPPTEFASPPAEFADSESTSPQPQKKKLGLNTSSFPWLAEPQPSFNAEIKDVKSDVQKDAQKSPVHIAPTDDNVKQTTNEKPIPDEAKRTSSGVKIEKQMKYESSPAFEVPPPLIQDETLESQPSKISDLGDNEKGLSEGGMEIYKTPFDVVEADMPASEELDEGFNDLPDPILEASVNKNMESKDTDTGVKGVGQYKLDLSEGTEMSPPTPPLTSPPGSGYVSPSLPSPFCSPREETHPDPPPPAEFGSVKKENEPRVETTKNIVSSSSYSSTVVNGSEPIELPNPPPITVPPLRRYSDLAADIPFATTGIKTSSDEPPSKESEKNTTSSSNKEESSQVKPSQPASAYKRPTPSAFKTQSWADIKNREKELEEQRKKKNEQSSSREPPPASLVFRNLNRNSANAIRPKSWVAPSSKSFNPILPSMYKPPESTKQANSTTDVKGQTTESEKGSLSGQTVKTPEMTKSTDSKSITKKDTVEHKPVTIIPMSSDTDTKTSGSSKDKPVTIIPMSSATDTKTSGSSKDKPVTIIPMSSATDTKTSGSSKNKPVTIIPMSSDTDTKTFGSSKNKPVTIIPMSSETKDNNKENKDSSSSQSTTKVVMRKKTDKPDMGEKRKSVQDMMTMFGASKDSRRNSDDATPQQSPAMRSLEEKIKKPNKHFGISSLVDTLSKKPGQDDSTADIKSETKAEDSSAKSTKDTKAKGTEGLSAERAYKIILANDEQAISGKKDGVKKEESEKEEPKANDSKPRSNSLNPREKYNVLFPAKNDSKDKSKSSSSSHEKKDTKPSGSTSSSSQASTTDASVEARKDQEISSESVVTLREKETAKPVDPFKRHSMPVYVSENNERQKQQSGSNLKILMAHQITDVDVVPRGRVAAMKAAWKKEGN